MPPSFSGGGSLRPPGARSDHRAALIFCYDGIGSSYALTRRLAGQVPARRLRGGSGRSPRVTACGAGPSVTNVTCPSRAREKNRGGKPPRRSVMNSRRVSRSAGRIDDEQFAGSTMSSSPDRRVGRRAGRDPRRQLEGIAPPIRRPPARSRRRRLVRCPRRFFTSIAHGERSGHLTGTFRTRCRAARPANPQASRP